MPTGYAVALWLDDRRLLEVKLDAFLPRVGGAWLVVDGRRRPLRAASDVPARAARYAYGTPWYVRGLLRDGAQGEPEPPLPLYAMTSLAALDAHLARCAERHEWTLLPWGGTADYGCLAFVSADAGLLDVFAAAGPNESPVREQLGDPRAFDLRLRRHQVTTSLADAVTALVLAESDPAGAWVWEACGLANDPPVVVCPLIDLADPPYWWEPDFEVRELAHIGPYADEEPLGVYRPADRGTFLALCGRYSDAPPTLVVSPGTTPVSTIDQVLSRTESNEAVSDLRNLSAWQELGDWAYALGRCHADDVYSLFVCREPGTAARRLPGAGPGMPQMISCV